jgi:hypothetical protein
MALNDAQKKKLLNLGGLEHYDNQIKNYIANQLGALELPNITEMFKYKGSLSDKGALPKPEELNDSNVGDVYYIEDE